MTANDPKRPYNSKRKIALEKLNGVMAVPVARSLWRTWQRY